MTPGVVGGGYFYFLLDLGRSSLLFGGYKNPKKKVPNTKYKETNNAYSNNNYTKPTSDGIRMF